MRRRRFHLRCGCSKTPQHQEHIDSGARFLNCEKHGSQRIVRVAGRTSQPAEGDAS